jgi:uncharacterized protein (TIGR04222 family)
MAAGEREFFWDTDAGPLDLYDVALLRGGEPLAVRVAAVRLHQAGALRVEDGRLAVAGTVSRDAHPVERAVHEAVASAQGKPDHIMTVIRRAAAAPALAGARRRLADELGLLVYATRRSDKLVRTAGVWSVIGVVVALEAVDYLFDVLSGWQAVLLAVPGLLLFWSLASLRTLRTRRGRRVLRQARDRSTSNRAELASPPGSAAGDEGRKSEVAHRSPATGVRLALDGWPSLTPAQAPFGAELYTALRGF